jgi:ribosome biogenesis protein ERB1
MKSSDFLVNLPDPQELRPFPTHVNQSYTHELQEKCGNTIGIAISGDGELLAICYSKALAIFDIRSTRCIHTIWSNKGEVFHGVQFNQTG